MNHPRAATAAAVLCLTLVGGCKDGALFAPGDEQLRAEEAASGWVSLHPDGWAAAVVSNAIPSRPEWTPSCSSPLTNGYVSLRLQTVGGDIELAFRCPISERTTPEELQEHFVRAVPWNLPMGVHVPNWRFQAWLPMSSIYDGVTFHSPTPGFLAVDIRSSMLGIRGASTRRGCATVPDSDTSSPCVITREHHVPMMMRFTVPADFSTLR